jgi:hypothetical protein
MFGDSDIKVVNPQKNLLAFVDRPSYGLFPWLGDFSLPEVTNCPGEGLLEEQRVTDYFNTPEKGQTSSKCFESGNSESFKS